MPDAPLYLTPPSSTRIQEHINAGNLGMITTPGQGNKLQPSGYWCADNGVWGGHYPGDEAYLRWLTAMAPHADRCLFAVAPDAVASHQGTINRSYDMLRKIRGLGYPVAFACQDGMQWCSWDPWDHIDCLFIGGSDDFKLSADAAMLADVARSIGKWVHMGRVNSWRRYEYADAIGCHSVDGTYLTNAPDKLLPAVLGWAQRARGQGAQCPVRTRHAATQRPRRARARAAQTELFAA